MNKNVIDQVEELKYHTSTNLRNINKGKIPTLINMPMTRKYSYYIHGMYYSMYKDDSMLFVVKDLPYTPYQKRHSYQDSLDNLITSQEVYPFLLFLDGKFIKWSDIIIIKDCKYSYIIVNGFIHDECTIDTIILPDTQIVSYSENQTSIIESTFAFDNDGLYSTNVISGNTYTTITLNDSNNIFNIKDTTTTNIKVKVSMDYKYKLYSENMFIFKNGLLQKNDNLKLYGLNTFEVENATSVNINYTYFYYKKSNSIQDNINIIRNKDDVTGEMVTTNTVGDYLLDLNRDFDFEYDKVSNYEMNFTNALSYIMQYNPDLMNDIYKRECNIIFRTYTGSTLLTNKSDTGYITMSRRIEDCLDNYVMIFHNGLLYSHYSELIYENKDFKFPAININDDDIFEILYFKNVDNRITKLKFWSGNDDYKFNLDSTIDISNSKLFSTDNEEKYFDLEHKDSLQYEVNFIASRNGSSVEMRPINSYFFDKTLSLVSNRQFRYTFKIITENTNYIELPDEFSFCKDINKYLVFLNGRKLDITQYKITIIKSTRPFDAACVYMNPVLQLSDKVEVFYAGDDLTEIYDNNDLSLSGNIVLDKSKLSYGFDKDLYMVFVNGKKIHPDNIINIAQNRLQILSDSNSTKNVSIIRCVKGDDELIDTFMNNTDSLTQICNGLTDNVMKQAFMKEFMTNTENDIKSNSINMRFILAQIIRKYWNRPFINTGEDLLYDFDTTELTKDESGNPILSDIFDANISYDDHGNIIEVVGSMIPDNNNPVIEADRSVETLTNNTNALEALSLLTGLTNSQLKDINDSTILKLLSTLEQNSKLTQQILDSLL